MIGYPGHAGVRLNNVATVLSELSEELAVDKLLKAARLCPVSWSQRLGYLLELVGQMDVAGALAPFVQESALSNSPLRRAAAVAGGRRTRRRMLIVNFEVEPDE